MRCGRFTSPHLARYNERICVDGAEADDASLIEAFERIDAARADITLTFFEYNALAALDRVPPFARSTWRCSKWGWADDSTPPTSSMRTSPWFARSASITSTGWATRWRPSAAKRPAFFARGAPRSSAAPICRAACGPPSRRWARAPWCPVATTVSARDLGQARTDGISSTGHFRCAICRSPRSRGYTRQPTRRLRSPR